MSASGSASGSGFGPGFLLVASPELVDPSFADSVVLLLEADAEGALGVVLNRPSGITVQDVLGGWWLLASPPEVVHQGGPVGADGALAVVLLAEEAPVPEGFRPIAPERFGGRLGLVDLEERTDEISVAVAELRVFAGYAGWGAGQLDREIEEGSWYVVPAEAMDAFVEDAPDLWREVLRRQPGELAWHATRPVDPDMN
ncbi:YqgE/AlgH family protein [Nocardioides sp. TRM66260-LWL]|uniref:YqgE/AlgH family protein n=1 Tax=Nocardioides sp. TRM66260-LWL TaxID=2874478 RepID=UPI001CC37FCB|nr:YqgE/AlgH family protein [Nocardioides sp. TRM66260-LWL]MBZ5732929.1 YqgE/AlgH family protein [Nocardioides sp. TRM66260-LWL]